MNTIISTHKLTKNFKGTCRVNEVDLDVKKGSIYGFLGPNGAGKSTTLKMLLGLSKPTKGDVCIFDKDFKNHREEILDQVGALIESPSYYGHLTGLENMRIIQKLRNVSNKNIEEVLRIVRLENQQHKQVKHYSLGMKQRLAIAMALASFPKLLILDEPTNGLDPNGIREIRELIKSLPQRYGITVLVSTHLLSEIEQMATSVGIIDNGNLLFQGDMKKLRTRSKKYISYLTTNNSTAKNILLTAGYSPSIIDNRLRIENLEDSQVIRLNQLLINNNIDILRIEENSKNLEDIFLELTGKERSI